MEIIYQIISGAIAVMKIPFTIWGHTLNLWQVFVFVVVLEIIAWVVWEVILGD